MSKIDNVKLRNLIIQEVNRRYASDDRSISKKKLEKIITEEVHLALLSDVELNTRVVRVLPETNKVNE